MKTQSQLFVMFLVISGLITGLLAVQTNLTRMIARHNAESAAWYSQGVLPADLR